jgi:hypothetical protein
VALGAMRCCAFGEGVAARFSRQSAAAGNTCKSMRGRSRRRTYQQYFKK